MFRWLASWPAWSAYAAAGWSALYGALGLFWAWGGGGFPFAPVDDDRASGSVLEGSSAGSVAPAMAVIGLIGVVAALAMARPWGRSGARMALLAFGWALAGTLALVIQDYTLLALVAFAPFLLVFAFTGVPGPQEGIGDILYWHRVNLIIMFAGGVLWALATLAYQRRTRQACAHCGRGGQAIARWATPEATRRWGRWAVYVACAAPVPYEVTRIAWYFGIPLGISDDFLRMMRETPGMAEVGLGCALASIGGAILTQGLIRRWGEIYPRWIWFRAGRRVPPALAVIPASIVAIAAIPAGLMNLRMGVEAGAGRTWGMNAPGVLWIVWGAALGIAACAYGLRRRRPCRHRRPEARREVPA
ncbi:NYN domain-containing protein [Nonomuraea diastatica]|uniref:NYN domain-containing protein n=1 Tax=Nonomuraea diastatica TaxID=1848329 RepID=A0A4R4WZT0_9ACTN|nr:NYN domain-containing protein [Nonomuraea diastatica]TDD23396.1 NYN domain-containing protein [Nonomuraea diastatica]